MRTFLLRHKRQREENDPARRAYATDPSLACPYGDQTIRASKVNEYGLEAARNIALRKGVLEEFLQSKDQEDKPLRSIVENLTALIERKSTERDKYLSGIGAATDATVVQGLVELAEKCAKEVKDATEKAADARKRLDSIDQYNASFQACSGLLMSFFTLESPLTHVTGSTGR